MGIRASFLPALLLLLALPAFGLDVSGRVVDKLGRPVAGAAACMDRPPATCATTDSTGSFRLQGEVVAVRPASPPERAALRLDASGLVLRAAAAGPAVLRWRDAGGRLLAPPARARLRAGDNRLPPPGGPAGSGLAFLELETGEGRSAWRVVLLDGGGAFSSAAAAPRRRAAGLAKAAFASSDILVSKEGYRTARYRPRLETESGVVITLVASGDSGFVYLSTFRSRVVSLDREAGTLVTESRSDTCNGSSPVTVTSRDTTRFAVRGDTLLRWLPGECAGEVFRAGDGDGGDVLGAWELVEPDFPLPPDLRPSGCGVDTLASLTLPPTVRESLSLADTSQVVRLSVEACPADLYIGLIDRFLLRDSTIALARNACREAAWRNASGQEAVLSFARRGADSLASSFTFQAAACASAERITTGEGIARNCAANDPAIAFLDCIAATGFFGDAPPPAGIPGSTAAGAPASRP